MGYLVLVISGFSMLESIKLSVAKRIPNSTNLVFIYLRIQTFLLDTTRVQC